MSLTSGTSLGAMALAVFLLSPRAAAALPVAQEPGPASPELRRVQLGTGTMMPKVERQVLPVSPRDAAGSPGVVEIEVVVGTGGTVIHARVAKSSDASGSLDGVAVEAARQWRFAPAVRPARGPVPALVMLRFEFAPPGSPGQTPRVSSRMSELLLTPLPARDDFSALDTYDRKTPGLQNPRPVREALPSYTAGAMRARVQGTVAVEVVILADGTVGATRVTKSLHEELDRQALIAARYWLFEPARLDGRPVACKAALELLFRLF